MKRRLSPTEEEDEDVGEKVSEPVAEAFLPSPPSPKRDRKDIPETAGIEETSALALDVASEAPTEPANEAVEGVATPVAAEEALDVVAPSDYTKATLVASESAAELPICRYRKEIVEAVRQHRIVVLVGETGSGKTTQVPRYLHEAGMTQKGAIAVTQPRRIAAISVASRVASEMSCELGGLVGYHVRFANWTSNETLVKYMTDGVLVRESAGKFGLGSLSVVVLDEAHERSVQTDVLLGLVKSALDSGDHERLRVVVMSATLNAMPFVNFFGGPEKVKLLNVPGRQHPVKIYNTPTPEPDFMEAAMIAVLQIHVWRPSGDILVFLPGQQDIEGLERLLNEKRGLIAARRRDAPNEPVFGLPQGDAASTGRAGASRQPSPSASKVDDLVVRTLFASLPLDQQQQVFEAAPPGIRKVVLATNIAETSVTIPGIRYVVDVGLVKLKICHPQTGVDILRLVETSQASATQRAGRAGREAPGEVYRLYVESEFSRMPAHTPPEIVRCEMASVYLQLKSLGIESIPKFPLLDKPPPEALVKAAHFLCRIGALDRTNQLTDVGRKLAAMPIHPLYAYCLLIAVEFECVAEVLSIVAMLSAETPFFVARNKDQVARESKPLLHVDGDHLTLLSIYSQWAKAGHRQTFARRHALNHSALELASTIRGQLKELLYSAWGVKQITSCGGPKNWVVVRRCFLKACFTQTARLDEVNQNCYQTLLTRQVAKLHPSSVLFRKRPLPQCVIYAELVTTSKNYLRMVTEVDPMWLSELCPQHFAPSGLGGG
eukprot:TRINITY_DN44694_c0_g1_i1.p1 TRINITY_DN44694_c0_g1~~TRINITY_DN44694_c0_g1_i1.p1  ORF type:complete len:776 (+),score=140.65 TRINITY_DN44694_c0_g1_i1:76-2403(+)